MIDYLEQCPTINGKYYTGELRWLCQEIARKKLEKLTHIILLLQDNAPAHTSQVVMTAASECGFEIVPHPPQLPGSSLIRVYIVCFHENPCLKCT